MSEQIALSAKLIKNRSIVIGEYGVDISRVSSSHKTLTIQTVGNTVTIAVDMGTREGYKNIVTLIDNEISQRVEILLSEVTSPNSATTLYSLLPEIIEKYRDHANTQDQEKDDVRHTVGLNYLGTDDEPEFVGFTITTKSVVPRSVYTPQHTTETKDFFFVQPPTKSYYNLPVSTENLVTEGIQYAISTDGILTVTLTKEIPNHLPDNTLVVTHNLKPYSSDICRIVVDHLLKGETKLHLNLNWYMFPQGKNTIKIDVSVPYTNASRTAELKDSPQFWEGTVVLKKSNEQYMSAAPDTMLIDMQLTIAGEDRWWKHNELNVWSKKDLLRTIFCSPTELVTKRKGYLTSRLANLRQQIINESGINYPAALFPYLLLAVNQLYERIYKNELDFTSLVLNYYVQQTHETIDKILATLECLLTLLNIGIPERNSQSNPTDTLFHTTDAYGNITPHLLRIPRF